MLFLKEVASLAFWLCYRHTKVVQKNCWYVKSFGIGYNYTKEYQVQYITTYLYLIFFCIDI